MDGESLSFEALQGALSRCMAAHPPEGIELRLHEDANAMAGLWALLSYEGRASVRIDEVKPKVLDAYRRWAV